METENKLTHSQLKSIEAFCCDLAVKAGEQIMLVYNNESLFDFVDYKSDTSPLTSADLRANKLIVNALKTQYPKYAVLSEEEADNLERLNNSFCFIVDPLDGTKEFLKRNGEFTVNIALSYNQRAIMGVIYVPATRELYFASASNGAYYRNDTGAVQNIHVTGEEDLSKVRAVVSRSHNCAEMDSLVQKYNLKNFKRMGSSLKGCLIARGEAEIYYRHGFTMEWDTAAMQVIAEEAGATFRQLDGSEMLYNRKNSLNEKGFYIVNSKQNIL